MNYLICFFVSLLAFSSPLIAMEIDEEGCFNRPYLEKTSFQHIEGKGLGYQQGYTSLDFFFAPPLIKCNFLPFLDLRGHVFNDGKFAVNTGLGLRFLEECTRYVYGANIFYDYLETKRKNYHQVSAGVEMLGARWDLRVNGYFPVGTTRTKAYHYYFADFPNSTAFIISADRQRAMTGVDAEAGYHFSERKCIDLYAAIGSYYYRTNGHGSVNTTGGRLRFLCSYFSHLTLEGIISYDHLFKWAGQGALMFNWPFGPQTSLKRCRFLQERLVQPVQFNEIITIKKLRQSFN